MHECDWFLASLFVTSWSVFIYWASSHANVWNKRKCLQEKRVQLAQDWFGTCTNVAAVGLF